MSEDVKSKAYTLEERLNQVCLKASKQSESDRNLLQWIKENDQEFWEENKLKRGILRQTLDRYRLIRRESKQKTISKRSRASHLLKPFQSPQIDSLPSISSYSTLFSTFVSH